MPKDVRRWLIHCQLHVEVWLARKVLHRSCKMGVPFSQFTNYLDANRLQNFFVVLVCSSALTTNLAVSPITQS
jgi:hypothetical protein